MTLPLIKTLKAGPPPPKVVLLPDAMFFARAIEVAAGSTVADVTAQVELALETLSPFPPAQLYYGFYWPPGAERALVFAAYRRRFSSEQTAAWENAELVLPAFATMLGSKVQPNTTLVIPSADGLTALYWDSGSVPARFAFRALSPEATEAERTVARDELINAGAQGRNIVLTVPPEIETSHNERELSFHADGFPSHLSAAEAGSLDVRDKTALAALRRARARDLALWRGFLGLIALLILLGLGELALVGIGLRSAAQLTQVNAQRPVVDKIETAQNLTTRINELSTKRLLPFEMMAIVSDKKPEVVMFLRTSTSGLDNLTVEAQSTSPGAVSAYQAALSANPALEKVEIRDQRTRDNIMNFTLAVTFRPEALKPAVSTP